MPAQGDTGTVEVQQLGDGWYGGVDEDQSVAKRSSTSEPSSDGSTDHATQGSMASMYAPTPSSGASKASAGAATSNKTHNDDESPRAASDISASARLEVDDAKSSGPSSSIGGDTPRASPRMSSSQQSTSPPNSNRAPRPPKISLPSSSQSMAAHLAGRLSSSTPRVRTPVAQTPLSESHPPPATPLKHDWQNGASTEVALTPRSEEVIGGSLSSRQTRGGLLLDPGSGLLPQALQTPPAQRSIQLGASDSQGLHAPAKVTPSLSPSLPARPSPSEAATRAAAPSPPPVKQGSVGTISSIDDMLSRLRQARSAGSGASMWAPKAEDAATSAPSSEEKKTGKKESAPMSPPAAPKQKLERASRRSRESSGTGNGNGDKPSKSLLERLGPTIASEPSSEGAMQLAPDSSPEVGSKTLPRTKRDRLTSTKITDQDGQGTPNNALLGRLASPNTQQSPQTDDAAKTRRDTRRKDRLRTAATGQKLEAAPATSPGTSGQTTGSPVQSTNASAADHVQDRPVKTRLTSSPAPVAEAGDNGKDHHSPVDGFETESASDVNVGNDTMSSINWADDDDDESLPDLPEEWTRQTTHLSSSPEGETSAISDVASPLKSGSIKKPTRRSGRGHGSRNEVANNASPYSQRNKGKELFKTPSSPRMASDALTFRSPGRSSQQTTSKVDVHSAKKAPRELFPADRTKGGPRKSASRTQEHISSGNGKPRAG